MPDAANNEFLHRTVLLDDAVDALVWRRDGTYIDGTFGRGGHSRAVLRKLTPGARLLAFDKDPSAIAAAAVVKAEQAAQADAAEFDIVHHSFATLADTLAMRGMAAVSGVLLDLGVSSPQLDDASRGFSFRADGPLDMRMDTTRGESAAQWLTHASVEDMTRVIRDYGEERFAFSIAKAIAARRAASDTLGPLARTGELAALVAGAVKTREKGKDPATRTFQALRIHVNQELAELQVTLDAALSALEVGGRLVVISFHSLEDRIVKQFMQTHSTTPALGRRLPIRADALPTPPLRGVARLLPGAAEVAANPRARSAVMRVAEKVGPYHAHDAGAPTRAGHRPTRGARG